MSKAEVKSDDSERMANVGLPCDLSTGPVRVKELSMKQIITLGSDLVAVITALSEDRKSGPESKDDNSKFFATMLKEPAAFKGVCAVAAASCEKEAGHFEDLGITDWLRWMVKFKEVSHWEELKELFFQLVPEKVVREFLARRQPQPSDS